MKLAAPKSGRSWRLFRVLMRHLRIAVTRREKAWRIRMGCFLEHYLRCNSPDASSASSLRFPRDIGACTMRYVNHTLCAHASGTFSPCRSYPLKTSTARGFSLFCNVVTYAG